MDYTAAASGKILHVSDSFCPRGTQDWNWGRSRGLHIRTVGHQQSWVCVWRVRLEQQAGLKCILCTVLGTQGWNSRWSLLALNPV